MEDLFLIILIGILALDTTVAFQTMIAQPLFSCTLVGGYLGDWYTGLQLGMLLQLLWLNLIPAGGTRFPESNLASMVITVLVVEYQPEHLPHGVFALSLIIGIAVAYAGQWVTILDRRINTLILRMAKQYIDRNRLKWLGEVNILGGFKSFLLLGCLAGWGIIGGRFLCFDLLPRMGERWEAYLQLLQPAVWGIGLAMAFFLVLNMLRTIKRPGARTPAPSPAPAGPVLRKWPFWEQLAVFFRSLFIQATWNYKSMLSIGFQNSMLPALRRLYPDLAKQVTCAARHLDFFNAHPYLASYALGVAVRLEEDHVRGDTGAAEKLVRLKGLLISILGALGDRLFWGIIKPASMMLGVLLAAALPTLPAQLGGLAFTFLVYNFPHFRVRFRGLRLGYREGLLVNRELREEKFRNYFIIYSWIGIAAYILLWVALSVEMIVEDVLHFASIFGAALLAGGLYRFRPNFYMSLLLTLLFAVIVGVVISR
ncbi:MAG: PTS system mannose/fructose/sorbose family transporter subunit IID [Calditrichaeota bacterium]|nr:PTS system mannose/fructose/sorbose family transporter subunit IID [Calditrichota bacterium]